MSPAELRRLCEQELTVPLLVALDAIDMSETKGRKAERAGDLPFPVMRVGKVLRVATRDLAALLLTPDSSEAGSATDPAVALTDEPLGGPRDVEDTTVVRLRHA